MLNFNKKDVMMMRYSIVKKQDKNTHEVAETIKRALTANAWEYDEDDPELVICVGGDGTLLYGVHQYMDSINKLMFLGIHTGTLGFFTDYTQDELDVCLNDLLTRQPTIFSSPLLRVDVYVCNDPINEINKMRIENVVKSQIMDIYVDDEYFENCRGSGICLSTQAGSTAYNRSLKGAVIDSGLSVMQLAEITPIQHSKHRSLGNPYIMMENRHVKMISDDFTTAMLCYDHMAAPLQDAKEIHVCFSDKKVRFARYREYSYLKRLKNLY